MRISKSAQLVLAAALLHSATAAEPAPVAPRFSWEQTPTSLALRNGDKTVWRLVFDAKAPKSYFHPLATVEGEELTAFQPKDHLWHRGLWFSWKFINGLNYWEEDAKTGLAEGFTEITATKATANPDFSATVTLDFSYHPPGKPAVLTEKRTLAVSAPDKEGSYAIDWTSAFTTGTEPAVLNRTPPHGQGGVSWGGYAGLGLRFPSGIKGWSYTTSEGAQGAKEGNGKNARWVDFSGATAGIAIFDHPENLRQPSPWYLNEQLPYFSPALLYNEPLTLAPKQAFTLRYRVLVHRAGADLPARDWKRQ
jgi:hypothetical protein